jgi:hypothetical protein
MVSKAFSEISTYSEAAFENLASFLSIYFASFLLLFLFNLESFHS